MQIVNIIFLVQCVVLTYGSCVQYALCTRYICIMYVWQHAFYIACNLSPIQQTAFAYTSLHSARCRPSAICSVRYTSCQLILPGLPLYLMSIKYHAEPKRSKGGYAGTRARTQIHGGAIQTISIPLIDRAFSNEPKICLVCIYMLKNNCQPQGSDFFFFFSMCRHFVIILGVPNSFV